MTRVFRCDAGTLQKPRRTSQGYLRVDGWASRTGILEYRNPDGTLRRELREDMAVFDPDSLMGFEGAPVTDDHPLEMVDIHNAKHLTKGTVLSVGRRDGDHVAVSLVITDPDLIRKMESGKRQLSTGYYVELDETPGSHPKYGRYDARQVRVGPVNHLAVVERGRAGTAAVRMDAAVDVRLDYIEHEGNQWVVYSEDGKVLGKHPSEAEAQAQLRAVEASKHARGDSVHNLHVAKRVPNSKSRMDLEAALARIKELEAKLDAFEAAPAPADAPAEKKCPNCGAMNPADATKCSECGASLVAKTDAADFARLEGERDAARKDAEDAKAAATKATEDAKAEIEKVRKDAEESVSKRVRESLDVLTKANLVLGKDAKIKLDNKDTDLVDAPLRAVKCAVIKHVTGKTIAAEKHDAYVEAFFESALEAHAKGNASVAAAKAAVIDPTRTDAAPAPAKDPEAEAREALKNRYATAWMADNK